MEAKVYQFPIDINLPNESLPEAYSLIAPGCIPDNDFVITRDGSGKPVSCYSDMLWNFTSYDIKNRRVKLFFDNWSHDSNDESREVISNDIKYVFFIICWVTENGYRSVSSLYKPHEALVKLAQFTHLKRISIFDVLSSELLLQEFLFSCAGGVQITFNRILSLLVQAGSEKVGFSCCSPDGVKGFTKSLAQYRASLKQHPPIPSRIYLNLITILKNKLSEYERNLDGIIYLSKKHFDDSYDGGTLYRASQAARRDGFAFKFNPAANHNPGKKVILASDIETIEKIVDKFGLNDFFSNRCLEYKPNSFNRIFIEIYSICKLVIHVFTGMRHSEAAYLPYNCVHEFTYQGIKTFCIRGGTTKLGEKSAVWITNLEGLRAVRIAQKLALVIYEKVGIASPEESMELYRYPLFIKTVYARLGTTAKEESAGNTYFSVEQFECQEFFDIPIMEEDLNELERIDPFRVWREEDNFQLNSKWIFTTHQFRRSLALYASSSGVVSLPSLKRQLKHITENMSLYYSKGSSFAKNLLDLKRDHFVKDYQESMPISQALSYISEIIFSDERLFGPLGTNLEKKRNDFVIASDRDKTISMFKSGEVAYQETFLGGCATTTPCESKALRSLISCLSCNKAIIKKSKLETVIRAQKNMIEQLSPASVEFRSENEDLLSLKAVLRDIEEKEGVYE
jgi:hypothetical protein